MLVERRFARGGRVEVRQFDAAKLAFEAFERSLKLAVARPRDPDVMKGRVGLDGFTGVVVAQGDLKPRVEGTQALQVGRREGRRGETKCEHLQGFHDEVQLGRLLDAQRSHARPAVQGGLDEALVFEAAQRFAHRRAADSESLGDLLVAQRLFGRERAVDDPSAELRVDVLTGERTGAFRSGGRNRHPGLRFYLARCDM